MKIEELFCVRDKIVLITGGSRGLGEMMARAYVGNGQRCTFPLVMRRCVGTGRKNFPLSANASVFPPICLIDRLREELSKRENRLDVLVNNAGASWTTALDHFPRQDGIKSWT
jgi:NAD(P)-dependent dehydrogenase (short-subunit alcohol dehydrogenase family)